MTNDYYSQQKLNQLKLLFHTIPPIQTGGGINFNIFLGEAICLNVDQLTSQQNKQITTLIENLEFNKTVIYDTYNKINWLLFPTSENEIPRNWFRFPIVIQTQEEKNKKFDENQLNSSPSFCLRIDDYNSINDQKMYIKYQNIMNTFYKTINNKKLIKQFKKFFESIDQTNYMTGKWLCLSYS